MANFPLPSSGLPISMSMLRDFSPEEGSIEARLSGSFSRLTGSIEFDAPFSMSFYHGKTIYHFNVSTSGGPGFIAYLTPFQTAYNTQLTGSEHNLVANIDPNVELLASGSHLSGEGYEFDHWEVDGVNAGTQNPLAVNFTASFDNVVAVFGATPTRTATPSNTPTKTATPTNTPTPSITASPSNTVPQVLLLLKHQHQV